MRSDHKKPKNKQATADAAVHALVASTTASNSVIKSNKNCIITTHTIDSGVYKAVICVNATDRNETVQLK